MRALAILLAVVVTVLVALPLVPDATLPEIAAYRFELAVAAVVAAVLLLLVILAGGGRKAAPERPRAEAARPVVAVPPPAATHEADVVTLLALLQEKGRLVDFLMDDVAPYTDAQVGAAARVVHQGCKAVLKEHFAIRPVREEPEGSAVTVEADHPADQYRLVGTIKGAAPFTGRLVHRGWKADAVKLPRVLRPAGDRLPTIAPAEVEIT
ncbi:MAG: DUF2760 domain-containing protein [Rhodospirillales bacterium]|nr:MAG: DUF2760 domain-containing protein [Rhodospirillales bacterium]